MARYRLGPLGLDYDTNDGISGCTGWTASYREQVVGPMFTSRWRASLALLSAFLDAHVGGMLLACYVLTIYLANAAISAFGMVPVGLGLVAPAGVYFAGLALSLRDGLQETAGRRAVVWAILLGAAISAWLGGGLALASGVAFLVSELVDFAAYTPLRRHSWIGAVLLSNTVGAAVDSALFLWLAFGGLGAFWGQMLGKTWVTLLSVAAIAGWRALMRWHRRRRADAAQGVASGLMAHIRAEFSEE